jgi:6-pyruvoyltetrahydropterin/6-carboxytetrahydropterin synthase
MPFQSTKTFGHDLGLSVAFRQWRADSHCHLIHGYALSVKLTFGASHLDDRNWVIDFGGLKDIKQLLKDLFDHKLLVAKDDPKRAQLMELQTAGLADIVFVDHVGCEAFAAHVFEQVNVWLRVNKHRPRVHLLQVEIAEHGANSAIYKNPAC